MMWIAWLVASIFFLLASGFFSGSEMGLYCMNRLRLRLRVEKGHDLHAGQLLELGRQQQQTVLTILLGNNLANYLLTVMATGLVMELVSNGDLSTDLYIAATLAPLVFVFGDVVPKNWFRGDADRLMLRSAGLLWGCEVVFKSTGILWLLGRMTKLSARLAGHDENEDWRNPRVEVIGLLREGGMEGGLTEEQTRIIERVMNLSSVRIGAIMVPSRLVKTVPLEANRRQFEEIIETNKYSRLPVLSKDRRAVVGIVNVYDVLMQEADEPVSGCMTEPMMVPASESVAVILVQLRKAEQTMAVVTDPRHGYVGIITLKDVAEEIFGELAEW